MPGWMQDLTSSPERLGEVMGRGTPRGWTSLHRYDLHGAYEAWRPTDPDAAMRVAWALERHHDQLDRLSDLVADRLLETWAANGTLPLTQGASSLLQLQAACHGPTPTAPASLDTDVATRLALHERAASGDLEALWDQAAAPVLEHTEGEVVRRWYDPCLHDALAKGWHVRGTDPLGVHVAQTLGAATDPAMAWFAPWVDAADLKAAQSSRTPSTQVLDYLPSMDASGLLRLDPVSATPVEARQAGRDLQKVTDAWHAAMSARPGGSVGVELQLAPRQRALWVTIRADAWLRAGRADLALALLEPALDVTESGIGPHNPPMLFTLLAEARVATGRARQALDALRPAVEADPSLVGLRELISDLAVLQVIHRQGDSKEN